MHHTLTLSSLFKPSACVLALAAALAGCGGGGGGDAASPKNDAPTAKVLTAVYLTDDVSTENDAVWIGVQRITVLSPAGEQELAAYSPAQMLNLPTLRRAGSLVALAAVPVDATELRVYVDGRARLQRLDGSLQDLTLQTAAGVLSLRLEGWVPSSGALALDFDLPKFRVEGNTLVPSTRLAAGTDLASWNQRRAELEGTVLQRTDSQLVLQTRHHGQVTVAIDAQTTLLSAGASGWQAPVGSRVEIDARISGQGAQALGFTALRIRDRGTAGIDTPERATELHGRITAVDGSLVTLAVDRSNSLGSTGSVQIDVAQARFSRGSAALLAPGLTIEVELQPAASGTAVARIVEVEGAAKRGSDDSGSSSGSSGSGESHADDSYAEIKGLVQQVQGSTVLLLPLRGRGLAWVAGQPLRLDLGQAVFERGGLGCLVAGSAVEVKGTIGAGNTLVPVQVELEGACNAAWPVGGLSDDSSSSPVGMAGAVPAEVEGLVTAIRAGEFDLQVFKFEARVPKLATVTVRHGSATVYKHIDAGGLAVGQAIEAKGSLSGSTLEATKIERDD